jgi:hypothetical protein
VDLQLQSYFFRAGALPNTTLTRPDSKVRSTPPKRFVRLFYFNGSKSQKFLQKVRFMEPFLSTLPILVDYKLQKF